MPVLLKIAYKDLDDRPVRLPRQLEEIYVSEVHSADDINLLVVADAIDAEMGKMNFTSFTALSIDWEVVRCSVN